MLAYEHYVNNKHVMQGAQLHLCLFFFYFFILNVFILKVLLNRPHRALTLFPFTTNNNHNNLFDKNI